MIRALRELVIKIKDYLVDIYRSEIESINNFYRVNR